MLFLFYLRFLDTDCAGLPGPSQQTPVYSVTPGSLMGNLSRPEVPAYGLLAGNRGAGVNPSSGCLQNPQMGCPLAHTPLSPFSFLSLDSLEETPGPRKHHTGWPEPPT